MTKHQKPRYAPTGERIVRTITTPGRAVLPYGTTVLTRDDARLRRDPEGWFYVTRKGAAHGDALTVDELAFPIRVLHTGSGYDRTRAERRTTDRSARAHEAKVHRRKNPVATTGRYLGPARGQKAPARHGAGEGFLRGGVLPSRQLAGRGA